MYSNDVRSMENWFQCPTLLSYALGYHSTLGGPVVEGNAHAGSLHLSVTLAAQWIHWAEPKHLTLCKTNLFNKTLRSCHYSAIFAGFYPYEKNKYCCKIQT